MELKPKKLQEIYRKSMARQTIGSSIFGFVQSFSQADRLYSIAKESLLPDSKALKLARAAALAFCVRSLETLLRDLAMSAAISDDNFRGALVQRYWKKNYGEFNCQDAMHMELLLDQASFQRMESFKDVFALIFKVSIFEHLESQADIIFFLRSDAGRVYPKKTNIHEVVPGLEGYLKTIFETRHEIMHNANYVLPLDDEETESFQRIILFFGQVFAAIVGEKIKTDCNRSPEQLQVCVRFSTYAGIMSKLNAPEQKDAASVHEIIQKHREKEASSDHVDDPKNMMAIGPFLFQLHDVRSLDIESSNFSTPRFVPANYMHSVFPRPDGKLKFSMLARTEEC